MEKDRFTDKKPNAEEQQERLDIELAKFNDILTQSSIGQELLYRQDSCEYENAQLRLKVNPQGTPFKGGVHAIDLFIALVAEPGTDNSAKVVDSMLVGGIGPDGQYFLVAPELRLAHPDSWGDRTDDQIKLLADIYRELDGLRAEGVLPDLSPDFMSIDTPA